MAVRSSLRFCSGNKKLRLAVRSLQAAAAAALGLKEAASEICRRFEARKLKLAVRSLQAAAAAALGLKEAASEICRRFEAGAACRPPPPPWG